jgi:outer membrane receptor protein involved in Fe transport
VVRAQTNSTQQLQDENATLRQQVADLEARLNQTAPASTTTTTTTTTAGSGAPSVVTGGAGVTVLSPFEVQSTKDTGYLVGNSTSATHLNQPIQEIPNYIQVLSSDFIADTNMQNLTDLLKYTAAAGGDNHFVSARPANLATPSSSFTIRGFNVNNIERDGSSTAAFSDFNLDNVDRVDIVEGPAAVLYGSGYPGGVINMITRQPQFGRIPTTLDFTFGQNAFRHFVFDTNENFGDKAAVRVIGGWQNSYGQRHFEFDKDVNFTPEIAVSPFKSGQLKVTIEDQYLQSQDLYNSAGWIYPTGWFNSYYNPSPALMSAAGITTTNAAGLTPLQQYQYRIYNSQGGETNYGTDNANMLQGVNNTTPGTVYNAATGITTSNVSGAGQNPQGLPTVTTAMASPYAYYNNLSGLRVKDKAFDFHSRGSDDENDDNIFTMNVQASPTQWLDLHYLYNKSVELFNDVEGQVQPNADGYTFDTMVGPAALAGYYNHVEQHQGDMVISTNKWNLKNKLFLGFLYQTDLLQYQSTDGAYGSGGNGGQYFYGFTPGATNALGNPNYTYSPALVASTANVPVDQVLYSRGGAVLTVAQVYSNWDPSANQEPDIASTMPWLRENEDGYEYDYQDWYWMDRLTFLNDRLTVMYGYRDQQFKNGGEDEVPNYPYFIPPPYAGTEQNIYNQNAFDYGAGYEGTTFGTFRGSAFQYGATFDITKELTAYANFSRTFKFNAYYEGGESDGPADLTNLVANALSNGGGSYNYLGTTVTSVAQGTAIMINKGVNYPIANETGFNYEGGFKSSLWDGKLSGTLAFFEGTRQNIATDDAIAQQTTNEPFNSSTTMFAPTSSYYAARNFRWRTHGSTIEVAGTEFTGIITPIRNFQTVLNMAWMPTSKLTSSAEYTPAYAASSIANAINYDILFNSRQPNVPAETFSAFNKYTFSGGPANGLSLALGVRYSSERTYSQSVAANPLNGGAMIPSYWTFDADIAYPYEILGYKLSTRIGLYNLFDTTSYSGSDFTPDPHFNWVIDTRLSF